MESDASPEPLDMPLDLLRRITNQFSEERKLGRGSFGTVYMGVYPDGEKVAVKKLYDMPGLDDQQFMNEFKNLSRIRHQNIVRLVGYCRDIQEVQVMHEGKLVIAEKAHRALCLEYMSNGSLDKFLSDGCGRYDWHTCYKIIKGICQGLKYLHNDLKPPMYHLDIKPANVLLDENMVPRIADFGISRLFSGEQTRSTQSILGTLGYSPPEFIRSRLISNKFDIFSLGVVIIKMMAGCVGYYNSVEMSSQEFMNLVLENWTNRLPETLTLRNTYSEQVKICIQIGLSCVQEDRHKRPNIQDIVYMLEETETCAARKDPFLNFQEANRDTSPQCGSGPNGRRAHQIYPGSTFNQDVATTHYNYFEQYPAPREARLGDDSQFCRKENQQYSVGGDPLPGIEGFHISGEPRPGFTLRACGFFTNGTSCAKFQWVHYLEDGTMQPIVGATMHDYVVTLDDVGTILAVDCTPMDGNCHEGFLLREFANSKNKITYDPRMENDINICLSRRRAHFDVFVWHGYSNQWKKATLVLTPTAYQINISQRGSLASLFDEAAINEKYSPRLKIKIPHGRSTQFDFVTATGKIITVDIRGITESTNEDNDIRQRDLIVLIIRNRLGSAV